MFRVRWSCIVCCLLAMTTLAWRNSIDCDSAEFQTFCEQNSDLPNSMDFKLTDHLGEQFPLQILYGFSDPQNIHHFMMKVVADLNKKMRGNHPEYIYKMDESPPWQTLCASAVGADDSHDFYDLHRLCPDNLCGSTMSINVDDTEYAVSDFMTLLCPYTERVSIERQIESEYQPLICEWEPFMEQFGGNNVQNDTAMPSMFAVLLPEFSSLHQFAIGEEYDDIWCSFSYSDGSKEWTSSDHGCPDRYFQSAFEWNQPSKRRDPLSFATRNCTLDQVEQSGVTLIGLQCTLEMLRKRGPSDYTVWFQMKQMTHSPSATPSVPPSAAPSGYPSAEPSASPTSAPTPSPTAAPTAPNSYIPVIRSDRKDRSWGNTYCHDTYGTSLAVMETAADQARALLIGNGFKQEMFDIYWIYLNDKDNDSIWNTAEDTPCSDAQRDCKSILSWYSSAYDLVNVSPQRVCAGRSERRSATTNIPYYAKLQITNTMDAMMPRHRLCFSMSTKDQLKPSRLAMNYAMNIRIL